MMAERATEHGPPGCRRRLWRIDFERQGALVFPAKQCHNCHSLDAQDEQRGPAHDEVALRMTTVRLVRQLIQGGGNMLACGKNLSSAETTVLASFLATLHPPGQAPARDTSQLAQQTDLQ